MSYTLVHGFANAFDWVPVLGMVSITGQPVTLIIQDKSSGSVTELPFDLAIDVYSEYPEVFPGRS